MPKPLLLVLLLLLAAGCDRTTTPIADRDLVRGTALPPPDLAARAK
jgi:hypothetical protein